MTHRPHWWQAAVAYQIYPKSFFDSNGDGVGDLPGIMAKLDELEKLGIDLLWLTPVYRSPDDDNGYDISDYQAINPQYGTMADFERLLAEAHRRGMRVIMDLVINHTSDEHPWFIESRQSKDNPYRDYYIWRDGKDGREPNNWSSHFSRSAWTFDAQTNQYYLHLFSRKQPDLNWENPQVRAEIQAMIAWWLEKGIDGFRLDAINLISKAAGLPDNRPDGRYVLGTDGDYIFSLEHFRNGPAFHDYLQELNRNVFRHSDIVTVGECALLTIADTIAITAPERGELDMTFLFEHTDYYNLVAKDPQKLKEIITRWQVGLHGRGWTGLAFNNHDQPRVVSCFGNDTVYREPSAKLFATLLLTLEGTPFLYQGEEIGMTNTYYETILEYNDVATVNIYREKVAAGADPHLVFEQVRQTSRDRGRSPYQWNAGSQAGFTTGVPWLGPNRNYSEINLASNLADPNSIFHYYRQMIALRKQTPALILGEFVAQAAPPELFVYQRLYQEEVYQVVLNLSETQVSYSGSGQLLIGNYEPADPARLQPYEARLYKL
ncbi:MAG TPA: alpha-glucosidase [Anaerolineae bacterium]|nr:alpha-glucosidase [Anaerolineae bacterium]